MPAGIEPLLDDHSLGNQRRRHAPALAEAETEALVKQILTLLSFTLRIEPQLIRFVRRLLASARGEPGIESRLAIPGLR